MNSALGGDMVSVKLVNTLLMVLAAASVLAGCVADDPCLAAHRRAIPSPSGARRLDISTGPCPGSAPQALISFNHGSGGGGVFAVDDSMVAAEGRWISEDTAEISYPAAARVSKRESTIQYGKEHVTILYVIRPDSAR